MQVVVAEVLKMLVEEGMVVELLQEQRKVAEVMVAKVQHRQ